MKGFLLLLLVGLCACGWPIRSEDMPAVIQGLGQDSASGCFWLGGRGGGAGGAVTPGAPMVPLTGAYGSGEVLLGRVNSDNTELEIVNGSCKIKRGATTPDTGQPAEQPDHPPPLKWGMLNH